MKDKQKILGIFDGLLLIKSQWLSFFFAVLASFIILSLDFILTTSMPKVIDGLNIIIIEGNLSNIPLSTLILSSLIIFRPIVGWLINFFQIKVLLNILRNLEDDISRGANKIYMGNDNYSSENSANMLITHGRYYLDNYLIPLIRAITDIGSIIVICVGLFIQYPIPLILFVLTISILLSIYQLITQKLLRDNGELIINSYEQIIKLSEDGFAGKFGNYTMKEILDIKKRSMLILGSISQGLKYVIEFCFMFSFGIATIYMMIFSAGNFILFTSTFAYAGIRMLPSFSTVLAFYQGKTTAEFAITELSIHLKKTIN